MLNNNFKQWLKTVCTVGNSMPNATNMPVVKDTYGNNRTLLGVATIDSSRGNVAPISFGFFEPSLELDATDPGGIILGSGTTPVSRSDYALESMITRGLQFLISEVVGLSEDSGNPYITKVIVCTCTSNSPITIAEIGFYCTMVCQNGANSYTNACVLFDRTLLSSPITLNKNESCTINYTMVNQFDV